MRRMNRDGWALKSATFVAVLFAALFASGWAAGGFWTGLLSAVAICSGVAVAIFFSGTRRVCAPRFLRRGEH
jgi:hypothetical protein